MARPSKSVKTMNKHLTKEEKQKRLEREQKLKGSDDNIIPPKHLNARQKRIFNFIVDELHASGILGNLDIYILGVCVIAIDRLQEIEKMINKDPSNLQNRALLSAKEKYTKEFFRSCTELSITPSARAKIGQINFQVKANENDPLLKVLQFKPKET